MPYGLMGYSTKGGLCMNKSDRENLTTLKSLLNSDWQQV